MIEVFMLLLVFLVGIGSVVAAGLVLALRMLKKAQPKTQD